MEFGTDVHGPQRIQPKDSDDPLTFHLVLQKVNIFTSPGKLLPGTFVQIV